MTRGVTIGSGAIVAVGSVVSRDTPDHVGVAGNEATFVKTIEADRDLSESN